VTGDLVFWKGTERLSNWVIIPMHKQGDRSECTNYGDISLLSLPGKVFLESALENDELKLFK